MSIESTYTVRGNSIHVLELYSTVLSRLIVKQLLLLLLLIMFVPVMLLLVHFPVLIHVLVFAKRLLNVFLSLLLRILLIIISCSLILRA